MRFVKYHVDAGAHVEIPAIPAPKAGFASVGRPLPKMAAA